MKIQTKFTTEDDCIAYAETEGLHIISMVRHGEDAYFVITAVY